MNDYEETTAFLGQTGPYFWKAFFLLNLLFISTGYCGLYMVFVGAASQHHCLVPENANITEAWRNVSIPMDVVNGQPRITQCWRYSLAELTRLSALGSSPVDVNLSRIPLEGCLDGWTYNRSTFYSTIITEWDLVCDEEWKVPLTTSVVFLGFMFGSFISGQLSDRFGRKKILFISQAGQFFFMVGQALSPTWEAFCFSYFCMGFFQISAYLTTFVLGTETLSRTLRVLFTTLGAFLHYCIGYMLLPVIAFGLRDWRTLMLTLSSLNVTYIPLWWLVSESPRWLLSQGRVKEAEEILRHAAHRNRVTPPDPIFKEPELGNVTSKKEEKYTVLNVVRDGNIRAITSMCLLLWLSANVGYYGISLNTSNLNGNPYLNCFLSAATEVPAYLAASVILKRFPRKPVLSTFFFLGGGVLFFIQLVPENLQEVAVFLEMVGKFGFTLSFCVVYIYTAEVYPTVLRNIGIGICSSAARVGSILSPFVLFLARYSPFLPYIVMGSMTLGSCMVNLFLPETFNRKLPEKIEHMQKFRRCCTKDERNEPQENGTQLQEVTLSEHKF